MNISSGLLNWQSNNPNFLTVRYISNIQVMKSIMDIFSVEIEEDIKHINTELKKSGKIT